MKEVELERMKEVKYLEPTVLVNDDMGEHVGQRLREGGKMSEGRGLMLRWWRSLPHLQSYTISVMSCERKRKEVFDMKCLRRALRLSAKIVKRDIKQRRGNK